MIQGLYLHIPFCARRCHYCDFNTYEGLDALMPQYVEALLQDLERSAAGDDGQALRTVFFGGGTPSLLPPAQVGRLVKAARAAFPRSQGLEISLEANPGTVEAGTFAALRDVGINRLSLGVQALQPHHLQGLGRIHGHEEALRSVLAAQAAGFERLSIDLMFGLPGQTLPEWQASLAWALDLGLKHVSFYGLSIEAGTRFHALQAKGQLPLPEEGLQADMYLCGVEMLAKAGLAAYEISNFAAPGHACQHNRLYWLNAPTLGIGAGAWSYLHGERSGRLRRPQDYLQAIEAGAEPIEERETLKGRAARGEAAYLRLRLAEGLDLQAWQQEQGVAWDADFNGQTASLIKRQLLTLEQGRLFIPPHARLLANEVFVEFFIKSES